METFVAVCENQIKLVGKKGNLIPQSDGILKAVGLEEMNKGKRFEQMYKHFQRYEFTRAIRLVAYHQDLSFKEARNRISRYLLIDLGCRLTWADNETQRQSDMIITKCDLSQLLNMDLSTDDIIAKINAEGFNIRYIEMAA